MGFESSIIDRQSLICEDCDLKLVEFVVIDTPNTRSHTNKYRALCPNCKQETFYVIFPRDGYEFRMFPHDHILIADLISDFSDDITIVTDLILQYEV